ncbi:hypothetical protein HDU96_000304 [Phlyctochytrium bullatum]|nr:hypothetical protein HDU96_000304 [Phlyctochytrium bullatum]
MVSVKERIFTIIGIVGCIAGICGIIAHATSIVRNPPILQNQYIGLWFSFLLLITSGQLIHIDAFLETYVATKPSFIGNLVYQGIIATSAIICFISFCFLPEDGAAGIAWNLVILLLLAGCLYLLVVKGPKEFAPYDVRLRLAPHSYFFVRTQKTSPSDGDIRYSAGARFGNCLNVTLKIFHAVIAVLLMAGAIVAAYGSNTFKPRGTLYTVTMRDGRQFSMHILCQGAVDLATPSLWFTASAAHGTVDFYGVQKRLADAGRRVCVYDPPGFGWSAPALNDQHDFSAFYDSMLDVAGEKKPVIFVPWAGGASAVVRYASQNPGKVAGVVFMEVSPEGIEFADYSNRTRVTGDALKNYRRNELTGRVALSHIVLGVALPFPFMPAFTPENSISKNYEPADRRTEFRVQIWKHKMWVAQLEGIKRIFDIDDATEPLNAFVLPTSVPLAHIMCNLNDTQACDPIQAQGLNADCSELRRKNTFYRQSKIDMTRRIQPSATLIFNTDTDCKLDLPLNKPAFTASSILTAIANMTAKP